MRKAVVLQRQQIGFTLIQLVFVIEGCDEGEKQQGTLILWVKILNTKGIR